MLTFFSNPAWYFQGIGMNFSMINQRIIMSHLLRAFEWDLAPGSVHEGGIKYTEGSLGFLTPKEIDIVFRPRE
jgi:hypothetical protein